MQLQDQVALITGASQGIGRATALSFAAQGAAVVLNARGEAGLAQVADEIRQAGGRVAWLAGDVQDENTHQALVALAQREFGGLDIAVNNAGSTGQIKPLAELTLAEWSHTIGSNLSSAFLGARHQIPAMLARGQGALVFTSSFVGCSVGLPGMAAYGAAKSALVGLVKGITADYGAQGIRANAIMSGGVDTAMAGDAAQRDWAASLHAMKRIARPEEIAAAALFLASPAASFVTGAALYVDGGNAAVK